jgi:multidrug efflux system membrane fusion protein
MTANVVFANGTDAGLVLLPLTALARERDKPAVWVVDAATRKVALREVTVGQYREDGMTVTAGLAAGEVVVTAGVHKLRAGQEVRLASAAPVAPAAPAVAAKR